MAVTNQNRILELDALRGIAAISVVVFHYTLGNVFEFNQGGTGVDLFFIISGFVISLTLANTRSWKDFLVNRFSRLFPTYWAIVCFTTIIRILNGDSITVSRFLTNLTMVQRLFKVDDIDWVYWTLYVELFFYAFMLLLFVSKTYKYVEIIGFSFLILITLFHIPFVSENYPKYYRELNFKFPLVVYFPMFFSGILFYKMYFEKQTLLRYLLILMCFAIEISIFKVDIRPVFNLSKLEYSVMLFIWFSLFTLYINNKLGFLANKVTLFLGAISFSIYLVHQYLGLYIVLPLFGNKLLLPPVIGISIAVIFICLLSYIIMRYVEKPSMNFVRNKYKMYKLNK